MKTELLAPAGDIEAAYSAFYFGADAVYLGLRRFSARAEAVNFSPEELDEITAYAHAHHKKVYVTVNTLIQEDELPQVLDTLATCARCHADAVIVQDWGVARLIRTTFPDLAMHASTQMAIHNLAGAVAMKKMGFTRVVPARELTLAEIREIQQKSGLEVEVFIHGALCYSYSGLCLFSSLTTGRSANRGKCVYSCRDTFVVNGRQYHPFSMKDLALEKDALKLGGFSLKIEGRKKNALYVGAVVDYYRHILDTGRADRALSDNLKQIFARPWTKLHFNGRRKDVIEPDFVGHRGLPVGVVERVFNHTITLRPTHPIARYDGIQIDINGQEKPFGFSAENLVQNGRKVFEAVAGQSLTLTLPAHHPFIQKGDAVYLASSTRVKGAYDYVKPRPNAYKNRIPIDVDVFISPTQITACCGDKSAALDGAFALAQHPEQVENAARKAFDKTGDTVWEVRHLTCHNPDRLFVPASCFNELRRAFYAQLVPPEISAVLPPVQGLKTETKPPIWIVKTDDIHLAETLTDYDELIYILSPTDTPDLLKSLNADSLRLALPAILRPEHSWHPYIQRFWDAGYTRWEIDNPAGLTLLPAKADITLGGCVSMLNTQAIAQALSLGIRRFTFSVEDTRTNIAALARLTTQSVLVLYQDIPLFLSDNCIRENDCATCPRGRLEIPLSNGKGNYLAISERCQTTLIDAVPFALPPGAQDIPVGGFRIDFCHRKYTPARAQQIITALHRRQKITPSTSGNFEKQFAK